MNQLYLFPEEQRKERIFAAVAGYCQSRIIKAMPPNLHRQNEKSVLFKQEPQMFTSNRDWIQEKRAKYEP